MLKFTLKHKRRVRSCVICGAQRDRFIFFGTENGTMYIVSGNTFTTTPLSTGMIFDLKLHENYIYTAQQKAVNIYDINTNKEVDFFQDHDNSVKCIDIQTNILLSGSRDGSFAMNDVRSHKRIFKEEGTHKTIYDTPSGITNIKSYNHMIITAGANGNINVRDNRKNKLLTTFSPSGRGIVDMHVSKHYLMVNSLHSGIYLYPLSDINMGLYTPSSTVYSETRRFDNKSYMDDHHIFSTSDSHIQYITPSIAKKTKINIPNVNCILMNDLNVFLGSDTHIYQYNSCGILYLNQFKKRRIVH